MNRAGNYSNNRTIAYNLKKLRFTYGVTQRELAEHLNTKMLNISRIETLATRKISGKRLDEIEDFFGVPRGSLEAESAMYDDLPYLKSNKQRYTSRFCRICGTHLYEDSKFCHMCGTQVLS